ncbi:2-succinyl-6-hydroxy-2,4-cyclohexadiene-1-carboxylate synthase [soil metagenome]|jgi:2-succinyl-6-hydroxy-2,4-cyclohexadiene-1-carboxylate synthase
MGSSVDWRRVMAALEGRYRSIAVDLPGHGASTGLPPDAYTIEGTSRALLGLLDGLGVENPVIAGYSMGGRLALYLALRHPDRLSGIFLESASPGLESAEVRARRRRADEQKATRLESGDFREFLRYWYRQPLFASLARDEGLLRKTIEDKLRNDPAELATSLRGMGAGSQPSLWGELPDLRVPALAVAGERDEKFVGVSRRMETLGPGMTTAIVPEAGHNVHVEALARYLRLLRNFLGGP